MIRHGRRRTRARGFTLVEVLVALAIVAAGCAAVMSALTSAADSTVYLREKTFAEWIAVNQIGATRLAAKAPAEGESSGEVEFAGARWRWDQTISATQFPGMRRIDVSVRRLDAEQIITTRSGVIGEAIATPTGLQPSWRPPAAAPKANPPGSGPT